MLPCRSNGYSLIEVLVALLVLSAGVIGAASLQLSTWQLTQQSILHTEAQQLAAEMVEWIQAYREDLPDDFETLEVDVVSSSTAAGKHCFGRQCDADELSQFFAADWVSRVQTALPQAQLRLCRDAAPWDSGASSYRWECASNDDAGLVVKIGWFDKQSLEKPIQPLVVMRAVR